MRQPLLSRCHLPMYTRRRAQLPRHASHEFAKTIHMRVPGRSTRHPLFPSRPVECPTRREFEAVDNVSTGGNLFQKFG